MNSKKIFGVVLASFAMGVGGLAAGAVKNNTQKVNAAEHTATSNFVADIDDSDVPGLTNEGHKYFTSDTTINEKKYTPLSDVEMYMFDGESQKDPHISLMYQPGESANYYGGVLSPSGYMSLRYGPTTSTDGAMLIVSSKDPAHYAIKSVTVSAHSGHATNNAKTDNRIIVENIAGAKLLDQTKNFSQFFTDNSYTYEGTNIKSFTIMNMRGSSTHDGLYLTGISVVYEDVSYLTVTFDTDGGTSISPLYVESGAKIARPTDPTKPGEGNKSYEFDDWYTTADGNTKFDFENTTITADTTIYAHWIEHTVDSYTITFVENGGSEVTDLVVPAGEAATKPANPTRATSNSTKYSFTFGGWFTDDTLKTAYDWSASVTSNLTLYAKWSFAVKNVTPSGRTHYYPTSNLATWGSTEVYTNDVFYQDVTINSYSTFDTAKAYPELNMHIVSNDATHGFSVHKTSSVVIYNAKITITPADPAKLLTFAQLNLKNWNGTEYDFKLYKNSVAEENLLDTETSPNAVETTRMVYGSMPANERVKSVVIVTGASRVALGDLFLMIENDTTYTSAVNYATSFNDAAVCGSTPTDGLNETKWGEQKTAYLALDEAVRTYLTNCEETEGELGEMLERYDRVVKLHGVDYDFMGRVAANKIELSSYVPSIHIDTQGNIVVLITMVTTLSVIAVGILVITKKKRA